MMQGSRALKTAFILAGAGALSGSASVLALARPHSAPQRRGSLCGANETVLFQCRMGSQLAAVCGDPAAHDARYRFGTRGHVALESPAHALVYARTGYSGGGEIQFHFSRAGYDYVVYSRVLRTNFGPGGNDPKEQDGLFVRYNGRIVSQRRCSSAADLSEKVENFAGEGEFIYQE